jgi:hypothetical protein
MATVARVHPVASWTAAQKARHSRRAKSREKRHESFAASKAYDISTRQGVAIHTQHHGNRRSAQSRDHADVDGVGLGDLGQGLASSATLQREACEKLSVK